MVRICFKKKKIRVCSKHVFLPKIKCGVSYMLLFEKKNGYIMIKDNLGSAVPIKRYPFLPSKSLECTVTDVNSTRFSLVFLCLHCNCMLRRPGLGKEGFIWVMVSECSVQSCLPSCTRAGSHSRRCAEEAALYILAHRKKRKGREEEPRASYGP